MENKGLDLLKEEVIKHFTAFCMSHESCEGCPYHIVEIDPTTMYLENSDICAVNYTIDYLKKL